MDLLSPELAEQIFNECDIRKTGALTVEDFRSLSELIDGQFTDADTAFIFEQLDLNKDGLVTKEEFVNGFARTLNLGESKGFSDIKRRGSLVVLSPVSRTASSAASPNDACIEETEDTIPKILYDFETDSGNLDSLPCQEEVLAFYGRLQSIGKPERLRSGSIPDLVTGFEKVIEGVCKELIEQRSQNERLQTLYKREKIRHNQQIDEVETNLTATLAEATEKVRREVCPAQMHSDAEAGQCLGRLADAANAASLQEREKLEREKDQLYQQFENELSELKSTIASLQKSVLDEENVKYEKSEEMRQKVQDLTKENMKLGHNLNQKQTELVLLQSAMARLRQNFDDKLSDWTTEKEHLVHLSENMNHQLQLLYEANRQLHDTNDNLRAALETRQACSRQLNLRTPSPIGFGGRLSPVVHTRLTGGGAWTPAGHQYDASPNDANPARPNTLGVRRQDAVWRRLEDSVETDEDVDSGMITRGSNTTSDSATDDDLQRRMVYGQAWNGHPCRDDVISQTLAASGAVFPAVPLDYSLVRTDSLSSSGTGTRSSHTCDSRSNGVVFQPTEPTGPPERTFRVVLVGDASVGKTSMIRRLVKGEFQENSATTIGVECQGKVLRVDGRNVALQLWDTAGQEKFRSLCKAYFRRADGAVLVYDCTCEQSFLNVRYWLDAVQESVTRKIPVLLCANKIDLRIAAAAQGHRFVSRDDGENLAKTHSILFVETSAKEGTNVCDAAVHLTREMLAAEDFEVRSTCVMLEQKKKSNCTTCKSS